MVPLNLTCIHGYNIFLNLFNLYYNLIQFDKYNKACVSVEFGSYPKFLNEWQVAIEEGPGFPLHVMYYEDLKKVMHLKLQ